MSAFGAAFTRTNTRATEPEVHIDLSDNTEPANNDQISNDELNEILPAILKRTSSRLNPTKVIQELSKRNYGKYSEERYNQEALANAIADVTSSASTSTAVPVTNVGTGIDTVATGSDSAGPAKARTSPDDVFRTGQQKLKGLLSGRKRLTGAQGSNTPIDVLYENQRGSWFFGTPLFSSKSLLNFDPSAWTSSTGEPSSVNITNAQLPDPSWEWVWKTWYVDMSLDVDEQGWQYSLLFSKQCAWHGTHPWFHSFVRRRRWIRKRDRAVTVAPSDVDELSGMGLGSTQKLTADYFSVRAADRGATSKGIMHDSRSDYKPNSLRTDVLTSEEPDVSDMPTLLKLLRKSTVDREKINLVVQYMDQGLEDIHYLAEEMPHIMSTLTYQHSKRQLLASMLRCLDQADPKDANTSHVHPKAKDKQAEQHPSIGVDPTDEDAEKSYERRARRHESLKKAVESADKEIQSLEYWSDVRQAGQAGESLGTAEAITELGGMSKSAS